MDYVPLDRSFWDKKPVNTGRGFNKFEMLGEYLRKCFPGWEFGVFSEDDIEDRRAIEGYIVLTPQHLRGAQDGWNSEVAVRFGLREVDGGLMIGRREDKLFICARPLDWGKQRRQQIFAESELSYDRARLGKAAEIKRQIGGGVDLGTSLVETSSQVPPESFNEGSNEDHSVYVNADQAAAKAGRKPGRPKTGGTE